MGAGIIFITTNTKNILYTKNYLLTFSPAALGSGANSCIALEVTTFPVVAAVPATTTAGGGIGGSCAPLDSLLIFSGFWNDDDELLSDQVGGDVRVWMVSSIRSLLVIFFVSGWTEVSANLKVSTDQTHYW